mgnify:CR=1 FL=1
MNQWGAETSPQPEQWLGNLWDKVLLSEHSFPEQVRVAESLPIRDVPPKLKNWIETEREQAMLSQREYVMCVLDKAYNSKAAPTLFDAPQHPEPTSTNGTPFTFVALFAVFAPTGRRVVATGGATRPCRAAAKGSASRNPRKRMSLILVLPRRGKGTARSTERHDMPGTYSQILLHVVFSTKGRAPWTTPDIAKRLYPYMGGIVRAEKGVLHDIGGVAALSRPPEARGTGVCRAEPSPDPTFPHSSNALPLCAQSRTIRRTHLRNRA